MRTDGGALRRAAIPARSESVDRAAPAAVRVENAPAPAGHARVAIARSHATRILHLALIATVLHQLIGSNFMERPLPGDDPGLPFLLHEGVGMGGFGLVLLFWLWTLLRDRRETSLARLMPWLSSSGRRAVLADIGASLRGLARLEAPPGGHAALAGAVHGLGLLTLTALALTGASWFLLFAGTPLGGIVIGMHGFFANLMWAYLIGHASVAILHHAVGDEVLSGMFWFRRRGRPKSAGAR